MRQHKSWPPHQRIMAIVSTGDGSRDNHTAEMTRLDITGTACTVRQAAQADTKLPDGAQLRVPGRVTKGSARNHGHGPYYKAAQHLPTKEPVELGQMKTRLPETRPRHHIGRNLVLMIERGPSSRRSRLPKRSVLIKTDCAATWRRIEGAHPSRMLRVNTR
ncbi:hypothetical protein MPH_03899 [Macrophomina phaseolina MS6]|uniref:Uncharacterized protein n=1 Tax=Macrophomina phaseolina (strain MS6) TaxID=1126212 RepID=K2RVQ5_MACPH|nr:hypothetical protein MPH_03899 [Macrophomina phaseolina MS6]